MLIIRLLSTRLKLLVTTWIVAEVLVFVGVAELIGLGRALLAGFAGALLGAWLLKRTGAAAMMRLRGALRGRRDGHPDDVLDGSLAAFAATALILPGFLSDAVGAALAIPLVRTRVARWVRAGGLGVRFKETGGRSGPRTIDLDGDEWTRTRTSGEGGKLLH